MGEDPGARRRRRARRGTQPVAVRRTVTVSLSSWTRVRHFFGRRRNGPAYVTVRGPALELDARLSVVFVLPDRARLSVDGRVEGVRYDGADSARMDVRLIGLSPRTAGALGAGLRPQPEADEGAARCDTPYEIEWDRALAAGTGDMKVSELIRGNLRLRDQLERMLRKL